MKKITSILLAVLMLASLAACGGAGGSADAPQTVELSLTEIVTKVYETKPMEMMLMEPTAVDLADADAVKMFTGLEDASNVKEAVFSEPMMSSQAYSFVLVRVNDASKTEETKKAMFEGIDTRKWICVEADQLRVVSCGDVIALIMVESGLGATLGDELKDAFVSATGLEASGEVLSK